tara:strand:- start:582 stop:845 length:264 start_codon:yes stop_codon:yes gene_type:complete
MIKSALFSMGLIATGTVALTDAKDVMYGIADQIIAVYASAASIDPYADPVQRAQQQEAMFQRASMLEPMAERLRQFDPDADNPFENL